MTYRPRPIGYTTNKKLRHLAPPLSMPIYTSPRNRKGMGREKRGGN